MWKIHCILLLIITAGLFACTEQNLPEFQNPQPISVPSGKPAHGPRLSEGQDGAVTLSWMERRKDVSSLRFSTYDQGSWLTAVTAAEDDKMFVNWADSPAVVPLGPESFLAHWLSYTADSPYAYRILSAFSGDGGATWSAPRVPHTDNTPTEHGFVSSYSAIDGTSLIWLDGRNTPDQGMTLRGATLGSDGTLSDEILLDDRVCDCCQTDVALTLSGPIAIYRDRTEDEVRDIYVARRLDGIWQAGTPISDDGWIISGCPVNGPSISAKGNLVVAAWFTAANDKPIVKAAVSTNAGKSFSEPVVVAATNVTGHVGVSSIDAHSFVVSWMESGKDGTYAIKIRALTEDRQLGRVNTVGRTSVARNVPQLVRIGDKLILAWTDEISDLSKIMSVSVPIRGFYD
jgi:hypothetical protein